MLYCAQEVLLEGPVVAQAEGEQPGGLPEGLGLDQIAAVMVLAQTHEVVGPVRAEGRGEHGEGCG